MSKPKVAGYWVAACSPQGDFVKWGKNGDTVHPFKNEEKAADCAEHISQSTCHKHDRIYILTVFENGQMLTEEFILEKYLSSDPVS